MINSRYIAVDWGTSHLRAYLCQIQCDQQAQVGLQVVLQDQAAGPGVGKRNTDFAQTLQQAIAPWLAEFGNLPVLLAGQIGSSIGWHETAYLPCPIVPQQILGNGFKFSYAEMQLTILPGLCCRLASQQFDVMRGEELQILGFLQLNPQFRQGEHLLCLPGTHTKWVLLRDGVIEYFKTAMTGELYDLLSRHSVLIQQPCPPEQLDWTAFTQGSDFTLTADAGNLVHGLFSVRTRQLFGGENSVQACSYLSGMLIGSDVRAALHATDWQLNADSSVVVIGGYPLLDCFSRVLQAVGIEPTMADVTTCTLRGFATEFLFQQQPQQQHNPTCPDLA
ncbi:2-dehydro-3-deoxygalactonokinase [Rheinheimera riviphila]|uniref:2-dehydro-3-deoxygalactonokinase n=1 Tax=Rheinheimera riviphila TaxID=1834037 RepID=A0A437R5T8_9GAMM|nr:2-dehydro-3-deoxygalactonokinase [Rheinheimera riviphila]RVU42037.1 2-dehydro-3-deoxygalactonokinase [Rheinheimera riviphila]